MTIEDVRTCEPTLEDVERVVLRTATSPAAAVAGTLLFLNVRQNICGDAADIIKYAGDMRKEK